MGQNLTNMDWSRASLVIKSILLLGISPTSSFKTNNCSHEQLEVSLNGFDSCVEEGISNDICAAFNQLDVCFHKHFEQCFSQSEIDAIIKNGKAVLRKALELILEDQQLQFGGFESGSLFDLCPGAPSHSQAQAADTRLIIWLDHADTDRGCTKREKDIVNYGAFQCLESERSKIEADIRTLFLRRTTLQENMCQVLSDTVGVCMKTELPKCFSPRERLFLVKSMVKDFKEIFTAMEELMGYQFNINVSVCSIWSSELLLSDGDNDFSGSLSFRSQSQQLQGLLSLSWLLVGVHFTTTALTQI